MDTEPFQFDLPADKVRDFAEALLQSAEQAASGGAAVDPYSGL